MKKHVLEMLNFCSSASYFNDDFSIFVICLCRLALLVHFRTFLVPFSTEVKETAILRLRPRFFAGNAYESSETSGDLFCRYWAEVSNGIYKNSQLGDRAKIEPDQNHEKICSKSALSGHHLPRP